MAQLIDINANIKTNNQQNAEYLSKIFENTNKQNEYLAQLRESNEAQAQLLAKLDMRAEEAIKVLKEIGVEVGNVNLGELKEILMSLVVWIGISALIILLLTLAQK